MNLKFKDSTNNHSVPTEHLDKWIQTMINDMEKNPDELYQLTTSGDSMVLIMRLCEEDGGGYEIIKTNNFDKAYYKNEIFN